MDFITALRMRNAATAQFKGLILELNDAQDEEKKVLEDDDGVQDNGSRSHSRSRSRSRSDSLSDRDNMSKTIIQEKTEELLHYKVQIAGLYKQLELKDELIAQLHTEFSRYDSLVQKVESELEMANKKCAVQQEENQLLVDQLMSHKNKAVDEMNDMICLMDNMKVKMMTEMPLDDGPIWSAEESEEFSFSGVSSFNKQEDYEFVQLLDNERTDSTSQLALSSSVKTSSVSGISGSSSSKSFGDPKFEFCLFFPNSISDVATLLAKTSNDIAYMASSDFDGSFRIHSLNLNPSERDNNLLYEKQFSTSLLKCDLSTHVESINSESGVNLKVKALCCDADGNVGINGIGHEQLSGAVVQYSRSNLGGIGTFGDYQSGYKKEKIETAKFFLSNELIAASSLGSLLFYSETGSGGYRMHNSVTVNANVPILDIDIKEGNIACLSKDNSVAFVDHRMSSPSHIMRGTGSHINRLQWNPVDRNLLQISSVSTVSTVDMRMYSRVQTIIVTDKTAVAKVSYSLCGKYLSLPLMNGLLQIYDSSSGKLMYHIKSGTSMGTRSPCLGCHFISHQHIVAQFQNHVELHSL